MEKFLMWTAMRVNRRTMLRRTLAAGFGMFAAAAVGYPGIALAATCSPSPVPCDPCNCGPHATCKSGCGAVCQQSTLMHPLPGCWNAGGTHECCDCDCRSGSFGFSCICSV